MTTPMTKPRAVVFDIGNVLIHWNPEGFYDRKYGEIHRRRFFAESRIEEVNEGIDRGDPWHDTIAAHAARHPNWSTEIMDWHDNWTQMITPIIPHSVRLLDALRAKDTPVFALTNFGRETWQVALGQFDFLHRFDRVWVSGELRLIKPDPAIYEAVERDSGIPAEELIFADDKAENIAAAAARGWQTHHFKHPEGWASALVAAGLLTEEEAQ